MTKAITARMLHTADATIDHPVIELSSDGTIVSITSDARVCAAETDTLTAAFLDVHIHGAVGHDVMQDSAAGLSRMQHFLATRGVAHYLPTTVTASIDTTLRALETIANAIESATPANETRPIGIHLEGPFLSHAKRGVHSPELLQPPSIKLFDRFQSAARGHILLITIAPEPHAAISTSGGPSFALSAKGGISGEARPLSGDTALDLIAHATSHGVKVSLGHTNATAAEALAAIAAGATSATHTYNAMRALDHREPGVLGTVLDDDRLFAELICDGVHVMPPLVRLWLKAKTSARAILVTDGMSATGCPDGDYMLGQLKVHVTGNVARLVSGLPPEKESLAGSVLTLDRAVANLQQFTQASLSEATRLASHTPAAMLDRPDLTALAPGSPAHLNRFNASGKLIATYLHGQPLIP